MELDVMLNNVCNAKCPICFTEANEKNKNLLISLKTIEKMLIEIAKSEHQVEIHYTGGEPTIHPYFTEIIEMTDKFNIPYQFVSNAYNLNLRYNWDKLNNLKKIVLSLYGPEAYHDKFVNLNGSFKKITKTIEYFENKKISIELNITCFNENIELLEELIDYIDNYKISKIKLYPVVKKGNALKNNYEISIDNYISKIESLPKSKNPIYYFNGSKDVICSCYNPKSIFINEYGNIYPCLPLKDINDTRIGNISESLLESFSKKSTFNCKELYKHNFIECSKFLKRR